MVFFGATSFHLNTFIHIWLNILTYCRKSPTKMLPLFTFICYFNTWIVFDKVNMRPRKILLVFIALIFAYYLTKFLRQMNRPERNKKNVRRINTKRNELLNLNSKYDIVWWMEYNLNELLLIRCKQVLCIKRFPIKNKYSV